MFGIGDYSFKPYKVAISGLHKQPYFSLLTPIGNKSVILDDTCYFIGFDHYADALFTASILNSQIILNFLEAIVFKDAKRPYTKELLMRIDLAKAAQSLNFEQLKVFWLSNHYSPGTNITDADFEIYKASFGQNALHGQMAFSFDL